MTPPSLLVMLRVDGLRADAVDDPTVHLPALRGLIARGARARRLVPVFPTVTWPRLRVDQYTLEFAIPVAGDFAVLRQLPDDRQIGLGCTDCRGERVDSAEEIAARVEQALRHVDAERVWLNPDCGFAPGSAADIPIDEAYAKLKSESAAARLLRDRHRS